MFSRSVPTKGCAEVFCGRLAEVVLRKEKSIWVKNPKIGLAITHIYSGVESHSLAAILFPRACSGQVASVAFS